MDKRFIFLFFSFLILSFFSSAGNAYALGLGGLPERLEILFEPNLTLSKTFYIINSDESEFPMIMSVQSDLKDYVNISEYEFMLGPRSSGNGAKMLSFTLSLPEKIESPGRHTITIYATQNVQNTGQGIVARLQLGYVFWVFVPYPGKYVEFDVKIENTTVNRSVKFTVDGRNRGNETIEEAEFIFSVYDPSGRLVASFASDKKSLQPNEEAEFTARWLANGVNPGKYSLVVEASYDGISQQKTMDFMLGSPTARILEVLANPIVNGSIGKITTTVASEWNERLTGMYVVLGLKKDSATYGARSNAFDLDPFGEANITTFWDTSNAGGVGKYEGLAILYYLNKTDNATFYVDVVEPALFGTQSYTLILIAVIAILIVIPLAMLLLRKRSKKKFGQKKLM